MKNPTSASTELKPGDVVTFTPIVYDPRTLIPIGIKMTVERIVKHSNAKVVFIDATGIAYQVLLPIEDLAKS